MTAFRLLVGVGLLVISLGPVVAAAWALRERLLGWTGVPARLVEAVLALSIVIVVSEIVGVVDLYRVAPMIVGLAAAGGLGWWWARREPGPRVSAALADGDRGPGTTLAGSQLGTWGRVLTVVVVAVVVADWIPRVAEAYRYGMLTIDTLWYHMPMTTRWVQLGSIRHVQYFDSDAVTAFYPANGELVHGLGILSLGSDILSPLLDLVWLGLALVAAWAIGRRYRVAPVTLAGAALLFATPGLVGTQPGGAYTDVVSIGLLLTTFAILVEAHRQEEPPLVAYGVAALAAGLAVGTKFTVLPAVGALTIAVVVVARRGARVRTGVVWVIGMAVTGGFWYVRNLVAVGNPLPSLGLHLGPITFHNLTNEGGYVGSVSRYVLHPTMWRQYLTPGLDGSLGWAWWALLLAAMVAMVAVLAVGPTRAWRLLAFTALAALIGFLFTQQIIGPPGHAIYFGVNVRYIAPALALGLVALPGVAVRWPVLRAPILALYLALLASLQLNPTLWPIHVLSMAFVPAVGNADSLIGIGVGVVLLIGGIAAVLVRPGHDVLRRDRWVGAGIVAALLVLGLVVLQPTYQDNRYATNQNPFVSWVWARDLHDQRIGISGAASIVQYPLYGLDLSNHVQFVGRRHSDGSFYAITTCSAWRRAANAGHYDYLYAASAGPGGKSASEWMKGDPAVTKLDAQGPGDLYRVHGRLDPAGCPPA